MKISNMILVFILLLISMLIVDIKGDYYVMYKKKCKTFTLEEYESKAVPMRCYGGTPESNKEEGQRK